MQVREAKQSDIKSIADLYEELNSEHNALLPEIFRKAARASIEWHIFSIFGNFNSIIFVAEEEEILGFAHITVEQVKSNPMFEDRCYTWVHNICVRKEKRGQGIGRSLMKAAESWGAERGAKSIELTVWEANEGALHFYESLSYITMNRHLTKSLSTEKN
ncbi:MAG: GNAT family N-acetyltransferase [Candidatus Thermoplasmatota archaeon]|nr:GNAT family N-acetyltransferase [Candidatus Thermoplasmatota archaeon]